MSRTVIVTGIARSGLTVTTQMLHAGGYPVLGTYPAFEDFQNNKLPWSQITGKAVKIVDIQCGFPPPGDYYVIRLRRNQKEQAKSQAKLLKHWAGINVTRSATRDLERSFDKGYKAINGWMDKQTAAMVLDFEEIINSPLLTAKKICNFISEDLDIKKMAAAVVSRETNCYPTMLEETFLK